MNYWHIVSSEEFKNGKPIDGDVYFINDTKEIYRGGTQFTESAELYKDMLPSNPSTNKLYINSDTLEVRIWDSSKWIIIIYAISDIVQNDTESAVSGSAVINYVSNEIKNKMEIQKKSKNNNVPVFNKKGQVIDSNVSINDILNGITLNIIK